MIIHCDSFDDGIRQVDPLHYINGVVGFAGSRHVQLPSSVCEQVISYFEPFGCQYVVACQRGVDFSFLTALSSSYERASSSYFYRACECTSSAGLSVAFTSPDCVPFPARYALRTLELVCSCDLLVLFSPQPLGRGSRLALETARRHDIPALCISA